MSLTRYLVPMVLVFGLAGCTTADPPVAPVPAMPEPMTITGTGSVTTPVDIPEGAQSMRVDLACTGGIFVVGAGGDLGADHSGQCGGVHHFALALPDRSAGQVEIQLLGTGHGDGDDEAFAATFTFSAEPKPVDEVMAADCATYGHVFTAMADAEAGFAAGDLDIAGWTDTLAAGVTELDNMIDRGSSPMIADQAATLRAWLGTVTEPGKPIQGAEPIEVQHANDLTGQLCADNGTIISVTPQYGG